ncbi:FAD-dependent oxidoreductase [Pendulispora albinea]|uniref:FAD-dependent oxidoreductase n=1 Tax=Pendulispora albinea TaxID=2741071 RepID=A0ABZ2LQV5_9BACT
MTSHTYAVVGGGVSGLAAAHVFAKRGYAVELLESGSILGGRIGHGSLDGHAVEFGGKNIGKTYRQFRELVALYGGHGYESFGINTSRAAGSSVVTLDSSKRLRSMLRYLKGVPRRDIARLAHYSARIFLDARNRFLGGPFFSKLPKRGDARLSSQFSDAFARAVLRPITVRMNAAEPDEAYIGNFGANLGMWLDSYDQLTAGFGPVLERIERAFPVVLNAKVESLRQEPSGHVTLSVARDGRTETRRYSGVVLAVPAPASAALLEAAAPRAARALQSVRYFPVTVVLAKYDRDIFTSAQRAFVFDPSVPLSNAGAYGMNALNVVRYTFSGRTARREVGVMSDEDLVRKGEALLSRYAEVPSGSRLAYAVRRFDPGLCAYSPDHGALVGALEGALRGRRIALAGDYLRGTSLESCVRSAEQAVDDVLGSQRPMAIDLSKEVYAHV